jgi:hypothetical protein
MRSDGTDLNAESGSNFLFLEQDSDFGRSIQNHPALGIIGAI